MKHCTHKECLKWKPLSDFYKNKHYADGYFCWCKECKKRVARETKCGQKWVEANREQSNSIKAKYVTDNPEKVRESKRKYDKANPGKILAKTRKHKAEKIQATPEWLTKEQIKEMELFYINRLKGYHVDHIVPLKGKNVRGLHVPWNLQYLEASVNQKKSNKY